MDWVGKVLSINSNNAPDQEKPPRAVLDQAIADAIVKEGVALACIQVRCFRVPPWLLHAVGWLRLAALPRLTPSPALALSLGKPKHPGRQGPKKARPQLARPPARPPAHPTHLSSRLHLAP